VKRLLFAALLLSLGASVQAKDLGKSIDAALDKCQSTASATPEIVSCYQVATKAWDVELNNQYKLLMKDLHAPANAKLQQSQRDWVKYKDSYFSGIEAFYQEQQGTVWAITAAQSKMNIIRDKTLDLDRLRRSTDMSGEGQ